MRMAAVKESSLRLGVDLGGTKIEAAVLDDEGQIRVRQRCATPQGDYRATIAAIVSLVNAVETSLGQHGLPTGICTPGSVSPTTGLVRNANSTCLNGQPLHQDLASALRRPLRLANDADCLAVSEARDGAAHQASSVFAVILGTGVGGGLVINGQLLQGAQAIAGEWGHNPLPWQQAQEYPGPRCWCGQQGCIETWLSGPGLAKDAGYPGLPIPALLDKARAGDVEAAQALQRYMARLARALAHVINLFDPEIIVLGGGLSNIPGLYDEVPQLWGQWVFSDAVSTRLSAAKYGDSSGVRGAAWLWPSAAV